MTDRGVIRGLLLDFYGTVVEDDDAIMLAIAARVAAGAGRGATAAEVMTVWEREYAAVAEGPVFRTLRESAAVSLATVMAAVGCPGDPAEFGAAQFGGPVPALRPGAPRVPAPGAQAADLRGLGRRPRGPGRGDRPSRRGPSTRWCAAPQVGA